MFNTIPIAEDLRSVGPAQQPTKVDSSVRDHEEKASEHMTWVKRIKKGTMKILEGDRRQMIPQNSKEDLLSCLELMSCKVELEFDWDIDMYIRPQPLREPRVHSSEVGHLEGDEKANEDTDEDEDDDAERPTWTRA